MRRATTTAAATFARAKRDAALYLVGWPDMHPSALWYWRCQITATLRRALSLRITERRAALARAGGAV